jgi:hypothetical protein
MPDIMLMLLQAGAQHTQPMGEVGPGTERWDAFKLLLKWRLQHDYSYGETAAKHLIDYGAWVNPYQTEAGSLRTYWTHRTACARALHSARDALYIVLRRSGAPRDIARLVIRSGVLGERLAWKEWEPKEKE